jgi:hypothetical protein
MSPTTLEDYALDFVKRGGWVSPCLPQTKIAQATPHGFRDRTRDLAQISRWWTKNPFYNIACNAGVILDIDSLATLEEVLAFAKRLGCPETLVLRSGRRNNYGAQLHFTGEAQCNGPFECDGVTGEVRNLSKNLYGLWAGSIHPGSGEKYEIAIDLPFAVWPAHVVLGKPHRRLLRSTSVSDEQATTAYRAQQTFDRLLREAARAKQGGRNAAAHSLTWFAARAFLAEVFEIGLDEFHPALSKNELGKLIGDAVRPLYAPGERDIRKMLNDSWGYGIAAGRLELDIYWSDLDRVLAVEDSERAHRLLDGNIEDFPGATAARDYLVALLDQAGFEGKDRERVLRYTQIDDKVAAQTLADLKVAEMLTE